MTGDELEREVKRELSSLRAEAAESTAKHLVMVGRLIDEDPEAAFEHAMAARRHAPRMAVVREAVGLAAYHCERYTEAVAELRAARRISGNDDHWPILADCERALGRPEKALQMAAAPEVAKLDLAGRVEMRIVAAGARADLGQLDAAVVTLQSPDLNTTSTEPWVARLRYTYAEALAEVGRLDEARTWFAKAAEADLDGLTPAAERLQELDGLTFLTDLDDDEDDADLDGVDDDGDGDGDDSEAESAEDEVQLTVRAEPDPSPAPDVTEELAGDVAVAEEVVAEGVVAEGVVIEGVVAEEVVIEEPAAEEPAVSQATHEALTLFSDLEPAIRTERPATGAAPSPWNDAGDLEEEGRG